MAILNGSKFTYLEDYPGGRPSDTIINRYFKKSELKEIDKLGTSKFVHATYSNPSNSNEGTTGALYIIYMPFDTAGSPLGEDKGVAAPNPPFGQDDSPGILSI